MNTVVTSKEIILEASKKLIREEGLNSINIRSVASACGVSVGSIYNYFDSKSELVAATVESIWSEIFHNSGRPFVCCSFVEYIEWLLENLKEGYQKYPGFFALHSMNFSQEEKARGQQLMQNSWQGILQNMLLVLQKDALVKPDAFDISFSPEKFVDFIFSHLIAALVRGDFDSSTLVEMIRRSIYLS